MNMIPLLTDRLIDPITPSGKAEHIELDHTLPGVNVLLNAVLRRANQ